jgi:hypothetical protein
MVGIRVSAMASPPSPLPVFAAHGKLSAATAITPLLSARIRPAARPETVRPVEQAAPAARIAAPREDAAAAAARLVAALRTASLWSPLRRDGAEGHAPAGTGAAGNPAAGEVLVQITARAALPLLPEPPSPARAAFTEAVIALRAGLRGSGPAAGTLAGRS